MDDGDAGPRSATLGRSRGGATAIATGTVERAATGVTVTVSSVKRGAAASAPATGPANAKPATERPSTAPARAPPSRSHYADDGATFSGTQTSRVVVGNKTHEGEWNLFKATYNSALPKDNQG